MVTMVEGVVGVIVEKMPIDTSCHRMRGIVDAGLLMISAAAILVVLALHLHR